MDQVVFARRGKRCPGDRNPPVVSGEAKPPTELRNLNLCSLTELKVRALFVSLRGAHVSSLSRS